MFPTRDVVDAADDVLQRERISQAILSAHPELEDRLVEDETRPMLLIPHPAGGQIVIAKMRREHMIRWVVAVPGTPEAAVHEPADLEDYPRLVGEALGLTRPR